LWVRGLGLGRAGQATWLVSFQGKAKPRATSPPRHPAPHRVRRR
jgi:hypothetical protein